MGKVNGPLFSGPAKRKKRKNKKGRKRKKEMKSLFFRFPLVSFSIVFKKDKRIEEKKRNKERKKIRKGEKNLFFFYFTGFFQKRTAEESKQTDHKLPDSDMSFSDLEFAFLFMQSPAKNKNTFS